MPAATVLFDLDGTLIDTIELILSSYRHTIKVHRGQTADDSRWLQGLGTPLQAQFLHFTEDTDELEAMVRTYREHNRRMHDSMVREYPGVRRFVTALAARGCRMGVVTSKSREMALRGLTRCGYEGLFEVVVGADDVDRHKPEPEPVLRALELLESGPETTVFVGDSPHDLVAGRAAGVGTAAVLWGPFHREALEPCQPDRWIAHPEELLSL